MGVRLGGMDEKGEGIKRCKWVVTKYSRGCKIQHRGYSQCIAISMCGVRWMLDFFG